MILKKTILYLTCTMVFTTNCKAEPSHMENLKEADLASRNGLIATQMKDWDKAIEYFKQAQKFHPRNPEYPNNIGFSYMNQNKMEEAIIYFTQALEIDPSYGRAYYNLGVVHQNINKEREAVEYYTKALEINPASPEIYFNLGLVHSRLGNKKIAISNFTKFIEIAPKEMKAPIEDAKKRINDLGK
ncbi:tetratricopeptide repeat protein [Leptospira sp. 'Mane']